MRNSSFIRDLLVKVLLIVIFIFLLMYLFPMPNLKPFYSSIFNNNIQTMKDAAEDYYTVERMPKVEGKSTKMTLQEMIDQKLIIPFVDKNGNSCDTKKSYVKVTKTKQEYELKVSLTCSDESNYIIEKIGCYNFCPTGNCTLASLKNEDTSVKTNTDKNGNVTVVEPSNSYVIEYEYKKNLSSENWKLGEWQTKEEKETNDVKLVDKRTLYTGQKKITSGTTLYEQISYDYRDTYTYDENWTTKTTCDGNCSLWKERTLYTGQKRVENKVTEYKHIKYGQRDNWTYDNDWTTKTTCDGNCTLWKERTLYTGQKKVESTKTEYKHVKYNTKTEWNKTDWTTVKRSESDEVKLIDTRYTVRKSVNKTVSTCDNFTLDTTWYTSKPSNTDTRVYADSPANTKNSGTLEVVDDSYTSDHMLPSEMGGYVYKFLYTGEDECTSACDGKATKTVYYFIKYKKSGSTEYQYNYCTPKVSSQTTVDEKVVSASEVNSYKNQGYTVVKTEYRYNVRSIVKYVEATKWTDSKTSPSGYEYSGQTATKTVVKYEQLNKWVTSKELLGEYTYNINTVKQYKYAHNNPEKYIVDIKWTESKTSPAGYEYANKTATKTIVSYEQLDKWVTNFDNLKEYVYNIHTVKQYKFKYLNRVKYVKDRIWTTENVARNGYELTGATKTTAKTTYIDLGRWVNSREELGEYTYNIRTKTEYRYKYRTVTNTVDVIWSRTNPGNGYEPTGNSRKVYIRDNRNKQK